MIYLPHKKYTLKSDTKRYKKYRKQVLSDRQQWHDNHREDFKKYEVFRNGELRDMVFDLLGDQCARCGIADYRVLQIDHINGGGSIERRKIGSRGIYIKILEDGGAGYQILCANCNTLKRAINKE
jgi:hypothetical protein